MSERKRLNILTRTLGEYYQNSLEYLFYCPKCEHHKKKLSVNLEKNVFKCWVCDWSGRDLYRIVRRYGSYDTKIEWKKITTRVEIESFTDKLFDRQVKVETKKIDLPEEFISLTNKNLPATAVYPINYLASRRIRKADIIRWKIGYCSEGEYSNRVIVPSFDLEGDISYFVGRSYADDWVKYKMPPVSKNVVFNHLYVDFDEEVILVEGVFDAIIAGQNSVPVLGSTLRENSRLFQEIVKNDSMIYLAFDADAEKKEMKVIESLLKYDIEVCKIKVGPYSDVGEMSKNEFLQRKNESELISAENFMRRKIHSI